MSEGRVLLVEDDEIIALMIEDTLAAAGHAVVTLGDGQAAWERLLAGDSAFDVILTDRNMPRMDGLALLRKLKETPALRNIPVVLETGETSPASIQEGIDQGAHYYLTKPFRPDLLVAVVNAAIEQCRDYRRLQDTVRRAEQPFIFLHEGRFRFRSVEEARLLAHFFAQAAADPTSVAIGLQELLINAVEHGNLGLAYRDKTRLLLENRWQEELDHRLTLPEYRERFVEVLFERLPTALRFTISDQGEGFDWTQYLEFDPARIFDPHGRGIAMARKLSFASLAYQGTGNCVIATSNLADQANHPLPD